MWRSRRKSSREVDTIDGFIRRPSSKLNFIHSSFKDVENLFSNDDYDDTGFNQTLVPCSHAARRLSIFHRVHFANKFARVFSGKLIHTSPESPPESNDLTAPETLFKSDDVISIMVKSLTESTDIAAAEKQSKCPPVSDNVATREKLSKPPPASNNVATREKLSKSVRVISIPAKSPLEANNVETLAKLAESDGEISVTESNYIVSPEKLSKSNGPILIPGSETRVVVYTTSLRIVRSTFEACRTVKSILRSFHVWIDERDLSMDSRFLDELHNIMKNAGDAGSEKAKLTLPRVFIGGRYVGGAEEVKHLHESGELKKFVQGLPAVTSGKCEVCGDFRFILCDECRGSHKWYAEKCGFRSCTLCNENGLIRSVHFTRRPAKPKEPTR
ncbi:hypothetical protein R6Q59_036831 [Mikania micrantha]